MSCAYCEGKRIVSMEIAKGDYGYLACPRCNGSGIEGQRKTPYYVIYINLQRRCIELHLPNCAHGMNKRVEDGHALSIGGDNVDPKDMVLTLPTQYQKMALLIEECLG